jgi:hypothetical protein
MEMLQNLQMMELFQLTNKIKEKIMAKKKLLLGILVLALLFGMMVVGCEEEPEEKPDTNPSPPTGLKGSFVSPNNSIRLTWDPVDRVEEYRIQYRNPAWLGDSNYVTGGSTKSASHTITNLEYATKYDFQVAVSNIDGYIGSYSSPVSIETGNPLTGNVSISSIKTTCTHFKDNIFPMPYGYKIEIELTLSDGPWWVSNDLSNYDFLKSWVTMTGTPNISTWKLTCAGIGSSSSRYKTLNFSFDYSSSADDVSISGLTVAIDSSKLTEMKGYTNAINNLTVGTPNTASSSKWEKNF